MSVPETIRMEIKEKLWREAEEINWASLSASDKSRRYTMWTERNDVGGRLSLFMDPRQVRVYIKDTLLKPYNRETSPNYAFVLRILGLNPDICARAKFVKPHGLLLDDGRQIAWSRASEWKATLMALHERTFAEGSPYAAVLHTAGAKFAIEADRLVVESAAQKLGIERIVWLG